MLLLGFCSVAFWVGAFKTGAVEIRSPAAASPNSNPYSTFPFFLLAAALKLHFPFLLPFLFRLSSGVGKWRVKKPEGGFKRGRIEDEEEMLHLAKKGGGKNPRCLFSKIE